MKAYVTGRVAARNTTFKGISTHSLLVKSKRALSKAEVRDILHDGNGDVVELEEPGFDGEG